MQREPKLRRAPVSPAARQPTMCRVRRQPEDRITWDPTTRRRRGHRSRIRLAIRAAECRSRRLHRTNRRRREAIRKAVRIVAIRRLDTAQRPRSRARRPTTRTTQPRRTRLLEPMAPVVPTPTAAAAGAIRAARAIPPDAATDRRRATPPDVATVRLRLIPRGTMDRASRMAAGARDRTLHRTPQEAVVVTTGAVAVVVTVAAAAAVTAAAADTDNQQRYGARIRAASQGPPFSSHQLSDVSHQLMLVPR